MSGQINDVFIFGNDEYSVSAIQNPDEFFNITELGITPTAGSTACWRGYIALFGIDTDNRLLLRELYTSKSDQKPKSIAGIQPVIEEFTIDKIDSLSTYAMMGCGVHYAGLDYVLNYTGAILITEGFIQDRYIHMGFQSPLSYEKVIELIFQDGICTAANDLSEIAAAKREEQSFDEKHFKSIPTWIEDSFDLSYKQRW